MPSQTTPELHTVPHDIAAEEAVLGALLIDPELISRVSTVLQPRDFYREKHGAIYAAMLALAGRGQGGDFVTLVGELERVGKLTEVGGASFIASLVNATPTTVHTDTYARRIEHCATYRRVIQAANRIAARAFEQPADPNQLLAEAAAIVDEVGKGRNTGHLLTPAERASQAYERYTKRQSGQKDGIPYGLLAFDKWTQGAEPGQLIVIAGRPAMGKSSLLQNIAEHMAKLGKKVLFASAEMPDSQLTDRAVGGEIGVSVHVLQDGNYSDRTFEAIGRALGVVSEWGWYGYDSADMTTASIRAAGLEMRAKYGLDAVFIDYLQVLHDRVRGNEVERVTTISRELKAIARALGVPVITASQLSRAVDSRDDKRPVLSDLRESGAIEQDADLVAFIYRPGYYSKDKNDTSAELIIAKQRNGPAGITAPLYFDKRLTRFLDAEHHHA